MLVPVLISMAVILGFVAWYLNVYSPKRNPLFKADVFLKQDMVDEAILEYRKALEKNPDDYLLHFKLAQLYFKQDRVDQGSLHLEEVMRIGMFTYEVEKLTIQRQLAQVYISREEVERAFQVYLDILSDFPADEEALYHVSFISLGQELFDTAQKYFDRLMKYRKDSFECNFGAGMAFYMNKNIADSVDYFRKATELKPESDIALLSLAFSMKEKHDYKNAATIIEKLISMETDEDAIFVARRLSAFLQAQQGKWREAYSMFEQLLDYTKSNDMTDEKVIVLYDIGFAAMKAGKNQNAYDYWNQLYQIQRDYKDVKNLIMLMRRELDIEDNKKDTLEETANDYTPIWLQEAFPDKFIWNICGLKSTLKIDMKNVIITQRVGSARPIPVSSGSDSPVDSDDKLAAFNDLGLENFKIIANRLLEKVGYSVTVIMDSYRENDGVDFTAKNLQTGNDCLVWVRRWKKTRVGEIPLRNFAQEINDRKLKEGLFVTTTPLTQSGETALKRLSKVSILCPEDVNNALQGLV